MLRVGGACCVAGAVVLLVANAAHPRPSRADVGDHEAFLRLAADSGPWSLIHGGILLGALLFLAGLAALSYALRDGPSAWLARVALVGAVAGTAVSVVQHSIDFAYGEIADDWAAASGQHQRTLLDVASAVEDVDFTLLAVNTVLFFGLTFFLYGLAVVAGDLFPPGLGWVAVLGGIGSAVVGVVQLYTGPSVVTLFVFPAFAALLSLWLLAVGVLLWRRAPGA